MGKGLRLHGIFVDTAYDQRRAAEISGGEMAILQHRSYRPVKHKDACGESVFEGLPAILPHLNICDFRGNSELFPF